MTEKVRGVVAKGIKEPVAVETIVVPDPGPGESPKELVRLKARAEPSSAIPRKPKRIIETAARAVEIISHGAMVGSIA